jgi:hypothetical protein
MQNYSQWDEIYKTDSKIYRPTKGNKKNQDDLDKLKTKHALAKCFDYRN